MAVPSIQTGLGGGCQPAIRWPRRDDRGKGAKVKEETRRELQANRYDPKTGTLVWTPGQVSAFEEIHNHFSELVYGRKASGDGLKPGMITNADDTRAITAFPWFKAAPHT